MKRCPECRRDYYDDTLAFCLEDGSALVQGSVPSPDEPQTAILHSTAAPGEAPTRAQIHMTDQTAVFPTGMGDVAAKPRSFDRRLLLAPLALAVIVLGGFFGYRYIVTAKQIESIAVMPFINESGNVDVEYLSDGMTETLISSLTNLPNLNVKARSTVFRYKGKEADTRTIGNELNVQAILTGRVTQRGDHLTLSLELVDVATENAIWSQQYSRKQSDLTTLQADISRDVSSKLKSRLSNAEVAKVEKNTKVNAEAYNLYLKGLFQYNRLTGSSITQAADYFKQSIEKDPNYAPAYVGLGKTLWSFPLWSLAEPKETYPQMKAAALKALELDDSLPGAHEILGGYLSDFEWDRVGAEKEYRRAIELDPSSMNACESLGWLLAFQKRFDEAITIGRRGTELDPGSVRTPHIQILIWARRYDEAIAELKPVQSLDPNYADTYWRLGTAYYGKGSYWESVASLQRYLELDDDPVTRAYLALASAKTGDRDEAVKQLDWLKQESSKRYITGTAFAITYIALGQKDEAYKWLEKDVDDRSGWATWYAVAPAFDDLRDEPRFKAMLKRMGLPE
jgi:TolB-like protein/Flp pilus assembly protein TadD